jgi:hypothetical protein
MRFSWIIDRVQSRLSMGSFVLCVLATVLAGAGDMKWG